MKFKKLRLKNNENEIYEKQIKFPNKIFLAKLQRSNSKIIKYKNLYKNYKRLKNIIAALPILSAASERSINKENKINLKRK